MKIQPIKRDTEAVNGGMWVDSIPNMGELKLKVRGRTSKLYESSVDKHMRAVPREERDRVGSLTGTARVRCVGLACHETVLLDWEGIEDEKGKPVKFSSELAKKWLTDPDFEHFLDAVLYASTVVDNSRAEVDQVKNS